MNMNKDELNDILEKHKLWLNNEAGGEQADLSGADLRFADLSGADLISADLGGADLSRADLRDAYLSGANLRRADLSCADLRDAVLSGANLRRADLGGADLRRADLSCADLRRADLSCADLGGADLSRADLRRADIDYSCWPLWCGSAGVRVDRKIYLQLLAHLCAVDVDDEDCRVHQRASLELAVKSHRAKDLGLEQAKLSNVLVERVRESDDRGRLSCEDMLND